LFQTFPLIFTRIFASSRRAIALLQAVAIFTLLALTQSCEHSAQEPVTLKYFRLGWLAQPDDLSTAAPLLQQFTRESGTELRNVPVPESTLDQLTLSRKLLGQPNSGPDVLGVDLIWAGELGSELVDLAPHIMEKLGATDRTQAVAIGVRRGIIQL
jgi:hypothetical protein